MIAAISGAFYLASADLATGANRDVVVHGEFREYLLPEAHDVLVNNDDGDEASVEHFEDVLVFQCLCGFLEKARVALQYQVPPHLIWLFMWTYFRPFS